MFALSDTLQRRFAALKSTADFWSLRHVQESRESYWVRRRVAQALSFVDDAGAMLTVRIAGVEAYAAQSGRFAGRAGACRADGPCSGRA